MRLNAALLPLGLISPIVVHASPVAPSAVKNAIQSAECIAVNAVVKVLSAYSSATPFCSSFLKIPTITQTATATLTSPTTAVLITTTGTNTVTANTVAVTGTAATVTAAAVTITAPAVTVTADVVTLTAGPATVTADTVTVTADQVTVTAPVSTVTQSASATITTCIVSGVQKRGLPSPSIPAILTVFASAQLSTACSCLAIPTPSTTVTSTVTITPGVTTRPGVAGTVTTTPTTTITPTVTVTLTSTLIPTITNTPLTTNTPVVTAIPTTTIVPTTTTTSVTTVVVTGTSTVISCPTPTLCSNQGLQFATYNNPFYNGDHPYSSFDASYFKSQSPDCIGVTSTAGGLYNTEPGPINVYGSCPRSSSDYFTINHRGYLFAQVTGTYTFAFTDVDDIALLWLGPLAYAGYDRSNANLETVIFGPVGSASFQAIQGQYIPLRIMFGNAQGAITFQVTVKAPDGTVILNSNSANSPFLVQYSCDGTTAPQYPPFGAEA